MATPQAFVRMIINLPDPRRVQPKDAQDTLVALMAEARAVTFEPYVDKYFVADVPGAGLVQGENPRVVNGTLVFDIRTPKPVGEGPALGRAELATDPGGQP